MDQRLRPLWAMLALNTDLLLNCLDDLEEAKARTTRMTPRYATPAPLVRRNAILLLTTLAATVIVLRVWLHASPNSDFDVGGYNVHHLFTGLLLIVAGGVPLAIFRGSTRRLDLALVCFGAGVGMALDEWVYLIATDGTNASYLLPVSLWGAVLLVAAACAYIVVLAGARVRAVRRTGHPASPAAG